MHYYHLQLDAGGKKVALGKDNGVRTCGADRNNDGTNLTEIMMKNFDRNNDGKVQDWQSKWDPATWLEQS